MILKLLAAAVTSVMIKERVSLDIEKPINIRLDRPFFYMIIDTKNKLPLFMGLAHQI